MDNVELDESKLKDFEEFEQEFAEYAFIDDLNNQIIDERNELKDTLKNMTPEERKSYLVEKSQAIKNQALNNNIPFFVVTEKDKKENK